MPQLGETVTEGTITRWYKTVGDEVARDEPLFEVSTDKVDSEVPAPATGVLTAILVEEGETVDVGATLAVIGDGSAPSAEGGSATSAPAPPAAAPAPPAPAAPAPSPPPPTPPVPPPASAPPPPPPAAPAPRPEPAPAPAPAPATASARDEADTDAAPTPSAGGRRTPGLVLSPVVRKILDENGIDPRTVKGTGLGGRITRDDAVAAATAANGTATAPAGSAPPQAAPATPSGPSTTPASAPPTGAPSEPAPVPSLSGQAPASGPAPAAGASPPAPAATAEGRDEIVPFTNIRRRTAEHMVRSKATSAHTLMVKEVDYERVEQVRRAYGARFRDEEGFGLSYLPFAARAAVEALAEYPHLNASVGDDALIVHRDVNLGIAVDLDNEGLIVPVVHNAEELNLLGMARRIRELAERARTRRLTLDDISNGTFSITNAGPFGTFLTGAIINQPQVAILSTDGVSRKPVVVTQPDGSESIAIHSVGLAAMSFDHRAVDGAYVARFLSLFADILDSRDWAGEL
jgi:2-oxoglutarate dehydrogenase E2 component (dihydrolipoamide succinyltransferase)